MAKQISKAQVVVSASGKPSYVQIPWEVYLSFSEGEKETLEILSDFWWSNELIKRFKVYKKNPKKALKNSISLD